MSSFYPLGTKAHVSFMIHCTFCKMPIKLYITPENPTVRAIQMTARALGVELELIEVRDERKPDFFQTLRKKSPYAVPTLMDENGFSLWDSHASMIYLVEKYGKDDSLYPKDLQKRALVDQRLFFNSGVFYWRSCQILRPLIFEQQTIIPSCKVSCILETYEFLNTFLKSQSWIAGDSLTIADFCLFASVSTSNVLVPIPDAHSKLLVWVQRMGALEAAEVNKKGLEMFTNIVRHVLVK